MTKNLIVPLIIISQIVSGIFGATIIDVDTTFPFGFYKMIEYAAKFGYSMEVHTNVQTEDGYLLDIHRILQGRRNFTQVPKPVAFLMHGLGTGAECWISPGMKSLGFILADQGYDVWLGNARGTAYSKKHIRLKPADPNFWNFSWHEIGFYDVPIMLQYVLNYTKEEELVYVAHSQGGTSYLVMTSMHPEMNKVIKLAVVLAPAVFFGTEGFSLPQDIISRTSEQLEFIRERLKVHEFGPWIREYVCQKWLASNQIFCNMFYFLLMFISNIDFSQIDYPNTVLWMKMIPNSSSSRQHLHYAQSTMAAKFRQYDFGARGNLKKYGNLSPPDYNLTKSVAPIAIFYGKGDMLVTPTNTRRLIRSLPNVVYTELVPHEAFSHSDFIMARDVVPLLHNTLVSLIANYTGREIYV